MERSLTSSLRGTHLMLSLLSLALAVTLAVAGNGIALVRGAGEGPHYLFCGAGHAVPA